MTSRKVYSTTITRVTDAMHMGQRVQHEESRNMYGTSCRACAVVSNLADDKGLTVEDDNGRCNRPELGGRESMIFCLVDADDVLRYICQVECHEVH